MSTSLTPAQYNVLVRYSGVNLRMTEAMIDAQYWLADNGYLAYDRYKPNPWSLTLKGRAVLHKIRKSLT